MLFDRPHKPLSGHSEDVAVHANRITNRQHLIHILNNLYREHLVLEARIPDHPETFTTTVLGINAKTNMMALDGINNQAGHQLFLQHKKLYLSWHKDGVELDCTLKLIAVKENSNISYYQVTIPDDLIYTQRRNDHRVSLVASSQFHGLVEKLKQINGFAADLSLHGIGLVLKNQEPVGLGAKITSCVLLLPEEEPLHFNLEVCFVQQIQLRGAVRIGGRFLDLDKRDKNRIAKIIRKVERKHAQMVRD